MSRLEYLKCDMCGEVTYPDMRPDEARRWGAFRSGPWQGEDEQDLDLCPACSKRVRRFMSDFAFNEVATKHVRPSEPCEAEDYE